MRKTLLLLAGISLFFASFFVSCQQQNSSTQTLRLTLDSDPTTLDPRKATDLNAHNIIRMLYDGLMRLDPNGQLVHSVARHHQISKDGKTYTFYLKDTKWSNGRSLTAFDFEHTWKEILKPKFPSGDCFKLFVIKNARGAKEGTLPLDSVGIRAINAQTLVVELENPTPYFLELTAQTAFFPVLKGTPVGSYSQSNGPFQLVSWKHNHQLLFRKNPFYWDYENTSLEELEINIVPNETTALSLFEGGNIDWIGQPFSPLPTDALDSLKNQWTIQRSPVSATCWLVFNTDKYPFHNENIRKAFSLAIHRSSLSKDVMQEESFPAYAPIPKMQNYESSIFYEDSSTSEAQAYLDKALQELGISKEALEITFKYNSSALNHRIAQALQNQWLENLGVAVKLEQNEWKVHLSQLKEKNFEMARTAWFADFSDPIAFLDLFKYKSNGTNYPSWENQKFTELLDASCTIADPIRRADMLKKAENIFISQMPVAPLYFYSYSFICRENLKKYVVSSIGEVDFKWAYFEKGKAR